MDLFCRRTCVLEVSVMVMVGIWNGYLLSWVYSGSGGYSVLVVATGV